MTAGASPTLTAENRGRFQTGIAPAWSNVASKTFAADSPAFEPSAEDRQIRRLATASNGQTPVSTVAITPPEPKSP